MAKLYSLILFISLAPLLLYGQVERNEQFEAGVQSFYNADWKHAQSVFDDLKEDSPDNPMPYFFESMIPFWKYFFVDQTHDLAEEFLERSEIAVEMSENRLEKFPSDTTMVLMLSGLHGYRSLVAAGEKEYLVAIRSGLTGFQYTRKLLQIDSERPDARIGKGMFYYMVGTIPKEIKWASNMMGIHGDMEMGLAELKLAAKSDSYVSNDAMMILMFLYDREEQFDEALGYAGQLIEKFPDNVIFKYKEAEIYRRAGQLETARQIYQEIVKRDHSELKLVTEKSIGILKEIEKITMKH